MAKITEKHITNNLKDVFYGEDGWEPHVRCIRLNGRWVPVYKQTAPKWVLDFLNKG